MRYFPLYILLAMVVFFGSCRAIQLGTVSEPPARVESVQPKVEPVPTAAEMAREERKQAAFRKLLGQKPVEPEPPSTTSSPVTRYPTVEAYFSAGNPNPLSHRLGQPNYQRNVSSHRRKAIIERDGGCCLVCGSKVQLEVDHRIALMNGGDNSNENLGTLCDSCHTKKTRYDYAIRKRRQKKETAKR